MEAATSRAGWTLRLVGGGVMAMEAATGPAEWTLRLVGGVVGCAGDREG
ncbi:hypothetical protein [Nocardia fluminea]